MPEHIPNHCSLGSVMEQIRKFNGFTQRNVQARSEKLFERSEFHIPAESLRKIESEHGGAGRRPTEARLRALAEIFRIYPVDWLLERAGVVTNQLPHILPRYPDLRPPFSLDVSRGLYGAVRARADLVQAHLPPEVTLHRVQNNTVRMMILIQQMRQMTSGQHAECVFEVPVKWNNKKYNFIIDYYVDSPAVLCALRELYGYPAKLGHAEFRTVVNDDIPSACLTISGLPLFTLDCVPKRQTPLSPPPGEPDPRLIHKKIMNPDGETRALDQLISILPVQGREPDPNRIYTYCYAEGSLQWLTDVYSTLWGVRDESIIFIYRTNIRITMPPGAVERDWIRDIR